jgi:hypothetical protein
MTVSVSIATEAKGAEANEYQFGDAAYLRSLFRACIFGLMSVDAAKATAVKCSRQFGFCLASSSRSSLKSTSVQSLLKNPNHIEEFVA